MLEDARKPFLLRDIPFALLRPLPVIYYFARHFKSATPKKTKELFKSNITFLCNALEYLAQDSELNDFHNLAGSIYNLNLVDQHQLVEAVEKESNKLARLSTEYKPLLFKKVRESQKVLNQMYDQTVTRLQVLLIDNNNEEQRVEKLKKSLSNFCRYRVIIANSHDKHFYDLLLNVDFAVFTSTKPPQILNDVQCLQILRRPGLALASINPDGKLDEQAVCHGSQLMNSGIRVLFKVFTPIRLYATIDKLYMSYYLEQ